METGCWECRVSPERSWRAWIPDVWSACWEIFRRLSKGESRILLLHPIPTRAPGLSNFKAQIGWSHSVRLARALIPRKEHYLVVRLCPQHSLDLPAPKGRLALMVPGQESHTWPHLSIPATTSVSSMLSLKRNVFGPSFCWCSWV